jgi:hypothetical protein
MSYPDARYLGDTGEISAVYRTRDQEPELIMRSGTASYLATGATTHGQFGLYRWDMAGPPSGPDPHFHKTISESFFILSGTVRLFGGEAGPTRPRGTSCSSPKAACTHSATSPASRRRC